MTDTNDMSKDYYQSFRTLLCDTAIDDLLKKTVGYNESIEGNNQVNEWVEQNVKTDAAFKKFDEIFSSCLHAYAALWFNLAWYRGWQAGTAQCLRFISENDPHSSDGMSIIERNFLSLMNFKPEFDFVNSINYNPIKFSPVPAFCQSTIICPLAGGDGQRFFSITI